MRYRERGKCPDCGASAVLQKHRVMWMEKRTGKPRFAGLCHGCHDAAHHPKDVDSDVLHGAKMAAARCGTLGAILRGENPYDVAHDIEDEDFYA